MMTNARRTAMRRLRPEYDQVRDAAASFVLLVLALVGFRASFGGAHAVVVGSIAAVLGIAIGYVGGRLRLNALVILAISLVVYVVAGGPLVAPRKTLLGLPTPSSFSGVVDGAINGWAGLLRTLTPAGTSGNLLAVPVVCGLAGGVLSMLLAVRTRRTELVVLPAAAVLVAAVLLGTRHPVSLALQGAVFAAVAMWWMSDRYERGRVVLREISIGRRLIYSVGMVIFAGVMAVAIAPSLPVLGGRDRYVLRDHTQPTFDPRNYPSPLVAYRRFVVGGNRDDVAFRIEGLPAGAAIRLAVLDAYDGVVWGVGDGADGAGRFQRAGTSLPVDARGESADVRIEIEELRGLWVPTVGAVRSISVDASIEERLRYNPTSGALAKPVGSNVDTLSQGEIYSFSVVAAPNPTAADVDDAAVDPAVAIDKSNIPQEFLTKAAELTKDAASAYERAQILATHFEAGYYSDGEVTSRSVPSGHSLSRLGTFTSANPMEGNAEQYAAAMALYARAADLPARVVVGFPPRSTAAGDEVEVLNHELSAWVEVAFEDVGWVAFDPTPDRTKSLGENVVVPPTTTSPGGDSQTTPPALNPELPEAAAKPPSTTQVPCRPGVDCEPGVGGGPYGWVILVASGVGVLTLLFGLPPLLIVLAKRRRRERRRRRPDVAAQVAGAWDELLDRARDFGRSPHGATTRREAADALAQPEILYLATDADSATFGADPPDERFSAAYWHRVEQSIAGIAAKHGRRARLRAAVSTSSFRKAKRSEEKT